jgi:hypothetical protein
VAQNERPSHTLMFDLTGIIPGGAAAFSQEKGDMSWRFFSAFCSV